MARTLTLLQMRTTARQYADVENSDHVGDSELTRYLNQAAARLYGMIVERDEDEFAVSVDRPVTAGATQVTIIAGGDDPTVSPYKVLNISLLSQSSEWVQLERFSLADEPGLSSVNPGLLPVTRYRLRGMNVVLFAPAVPVATTCRIVYIPSPTDMSSDSDTYDGRSGWEEWVLLEAAIRIRTKEESDVRTLVAERDRVLAQILPMFSARDRAHPDRVNDVTGRRRWNRIRVAL